MMKKLKLLIESYKIILIASGYALATTLTTALLLSWSKILAYMLVFIVVIELAYTILKILTCQDEKYDGDI